MNGEWVFLKIGKPLRDFADEASCRQLIEDLPILKEKGYNCLELNCYWHHLDKDGDGLVEGSLDPLADLINAIVAQEELLSRFSETLNRRMYTLSLVATLFLPLGFLTGLLGINVGGIPGADSPYGFLISCAGILVVVGCLLALLKAKKWF